MNGKNGMPRLAQALLAALLVVFCGHFAAHAQKKPAARNAGMPFALVSIEWVDSQRSNSAAGNTVYWDKKGSDRGVLIVLKLKKPGELEYYNSDFSLGYEDDAGIPRSSCVGICMGVATPDRVQQSTWMLASSKSRSWARPEKPFFGILFGVPRKVKRVTLYYAAPLMRDITVPATAAGAGS